MSVGYGFHFEQKNKAAVLQQSAKVKSTSKQNPTGIRRRKQEEFLPKTER